MFGFFEGGKQDKPVLKEEEVWGKEEDMVTASNAVEKGISDTPPETKTKNGKFDENGLYKSSVVDEEE